MSDQQSQAGFETEDVTPRFMAWVVSGLVLLVAVALVSVWLLSRFVWLEAAAPLPWELSGNRMEAEKEEPRSAPNDELERLRQRNFERLHGYGWVDREAGIVHIPIHDAMRLLATKPEDNSRDSSSRGGAEVRSMEGRVSK